MAEAARSSMNSQRILPAEQFGDFILKYYYKKCLNTNHEKKILEFNDMKNCNQLRESHFLHKLYVDLFPDPAILSLGPLDKKAKVKSNIIYMVTRAETTFLKLALLAVRACNVIIN